MITRAAPNRLAVHVDSRGARSTFCTMDADLRGTEVAARLELTPAELKVTYNALKTLLNDFGHDEYDVQRLIRSVLDKLPPAETIESIDLQLPRSRPRL
jgi:hypothetical protein